MQHKMPQIFKSIIIANIGIYFDSRIVKAKD